MDGGIITLETNNNKYNAEWKLCDDSTKSSIYLTSCIILDIDGRNYKIM